MPSRAEWGERSTLRDGGPDRERSGGGIIYKHRTTSPSLRVKGLRHSFVKLKLQSSLPTLMRRVGILTQEENLKNVDNIYIITEIIAKIVRNSLRINGT